MLVLHYSQFISSLDPKRGSAAMQYRSISDSLFLERVHQNIKKKYFLISCLTLSSISLVVFPLNVNAHCTWSHPGHCVSEPVENVGKAAELAVQGTAKTVEKAVQSTGKTAEKAIQDTVKTIEKAVTDTGKTLEKTAQDSGKALEKAAKDVERETVNGYENTMQAFEAAVKFVERQIHRTGASL